MIAPPAHDVILVGIGHTNAHVLRMWRMEPLKGMRLTCVSDEAVATYSGMLPGVLAGQYPPERMEIDLVRLTATAGARLIVDEVTGLDPARQELLFDSRAPVRFDVLSVGIGSVPGWGGVQVVDGRRIVPIKPMQTFLSRLEERLQAAAAERRREAIRILALGTYGPKRALRDRCGAARLVRSTFLAGELRVIAAARYRHRSRPDRCTRRHAVRRGDGIGHRERTRTFRNLATIDAPDALIGVADAASTGVVTPVDCTNASAGAPPRRSRAFRGSSPTSAVVVAVGRGDMRGSAVN